MLRQRGPPVSCSLAKLAHGADESVAAAMNRRNPRRRTGNISQNFADPEHCARERAPGDGHAAPELLKELVGGYHAFTVADQVDENIVEPALDVQRRSSLKELARGFSQLERSEFEGRHRRIHIWSDASRPNHEAAAAGPAELYQLAASSPEVAQIGGNTRAMAQESRTRRRARDPAGFASGGHRRDGRGPIENSVCLRARGLRLHGSRHRRSSTRRRQPPDTQ